MGGTSVAGFTQGARRATRPVGKQAHDRKRDGSRACHLPRWIVHAWWDRPSREVSVYPLGQLPVPVLGIGFEDWTLREMWRAG